MLFKRGIQVTILLCVLASNWCQNTTELTAPNNSIIELLPTSTSTPNTTNERSYDYMVRLSFSLNENKVPEFIVNASFTNSPDNSITVSSIAQLYGLNNITLPSASAALEALNIKPTAVISINSLEIILDALEIIFKDFYNQIFTERLNISGVMLRNFVLALGIDEKEFTSGMTYNEPDPFEEFKKGNFSKDSLEGALNGTGRTVEELFAACRDVLLSKAFTLETKELMGILNRYNFAQREALQLWQFLNITTGDVGAIPTFSNLLAKAVAELNAGSYLGVAIGESSIAVNKKVFDVWKSQAISKMYAQSMDGSTTLAIEGKHSTSDFENIVALRSNATYNHSIARWTATSQGIRNCTFVTLQNDTVVWEYVDEAKYVFPHFEITSNSSRADLAVGSPLVCRDEVYGLAVEEDDSGRVVFDSFVKIQVRSAGLTEVFSRCLILVSILGFYLVY